MLVLDQFDGVWLVEPGHGPAWWAVARTEGGTLAVYRRDAGAIALTFHDTLDAVALPAEVAAHAASALEALVRQVPASSAR